MCNCRKSMQQQSAQVSELETILQEAEYPGEYDYENEYETAYEDEYEYEDKRANIAPKPKMLWVRNTNLNAPCFVGKFNFLYNSGASEATVTFNTKISFKGRYTAQQKTDFINNLRQAADIWDKAAELQVRDKTGNYNHRIRLDFKVNIVTDSKNMNKETEVHPAGTKASIFLGKDREVVNWDLNLFINSQPPVIAHELGHIWGLSDEYKDSGVLGWLTMKTSPCHIGKGSPFVNDTASIMNAGGLTNAGEFRTRFFMHFGRALLNSFWNMPDYVTPIKHNGKIVSRTIQGRVALLKKDMTGAWPYGSDQPFNPQFGLITVTRRA
jgi:hypothetical protein